MLDIRIIRDQAEEVRERLKARGGEHWKLIDEVLACDEARRAAETAKQELQNKRKTISKQIGMMKSKGEDSSAIEAEVRGINEEISKHDAEAEAAGAKQTDLLLNIPNLPHAGCPVGDSEEANPVVREWGEKPQLTEPKDHVDLATKHGLISWDDAIRISGSGFAVYRGKGARLERALINFLLDTQSDNGYEEVNVPHLVLRECMEGTGQLPKFEDDMYGTEPAESDGRNTLFLAPTAEVPVTNLHMGRTLDGDQLPVKYCAFSPCFRREAGAAGKDTRGLLRVHQFHKVEMVKLVAPEDSWDELETLTADAEELLQKLGLPYRVLTLASGDLSFAASKCYDLEVWSAGVGKWLEVSSCSNFVDFQARRAGIRFKGKQGRGFVHTLNGSGLALPRILVAIMENYQTADGRIEVPEVLRPYMRGTEYIG